MGKKKTIKRLSSTKSKLDIFSTPISKRNLNATCVKSATRPSFSIASRNATFIKNSKMLIELGLAESQWMTYRINALYDFQYQKSMFRRYEQKLKSIVEADISKIGSESHYYNLNFEVEMQYFHKIDFSENDFPPLKIIIDSEDGNENDVYFTGVLLSVQRKQGLMEKPRKSVGATILPLFLVAYTDRIFFESVKYFLENNFGCLITPLKFSSYDLIWMVALFSPKNNQQSGVIHIEYACPLQELKTIQLAIDPITIVEVWNKILYPKSIKDVREIKERQVYEFINCLENHFFNIFRINLSELDLKLIKTPLATIQADHSVLLYDTSRLYFVMGHLTNLAQETVEFK